MSSNLYRCPEPQVREWCLAAGACAVGFARAGRVDSDHLDAFDRWIERGNHATMDYMARYRELRADPRRMFPGAATVISLAFPYRPAGGYHHGLIADYALGSDYHHALRAALFPVVAKLSESFGALSRVCVDTAPVLERYWAVTAGVGFIGLNRQLIVPGVGSGVFLAEIITTLELLPDRPCRLTCGECRRCIAACPTGALTAGGLDARRCRSFLTIESREPLATPIPEGQSVYGCDTCARVCVHNRCEPPEPLEAFRPDPRLIALDRASLAKMAPGDFKRLFKGSAVSRINCKKLRENAQINKI